MKIWIVLECFNCIKWRVARSAPNAKNVSHDIENKCCFTLYRAIPILICVQNESSFTTMLHPFPLFEKLSALWYFARAWWWVGMTYIFCVCLYILCAVWQLPTVCRTNLAMTVLIVFSAVIFQCLCCQHLLMLSSAGIHTIYPRLKVARETWTYHFRLVCFCLLFMREFSRWCLLLQNGYEGQGPILFSLVSGLQLCDVKIWSFARQHFIIGVTFMCCHFYQNLTLTILAFWLVGKLKRSELRSNRGKEVPS